MSPYLVGAWFIAALVVTLLSLIGSLFDRCD